MGGVNVVGVADHRGRWSQTIGFKTLRYWLAAGLLGFLTTLPSGVNNCLQDSCPRTKQGGSRPLKMNSTTACVFSNFMELHTITNHFLRAT